MIRQNEIKQNEMKLDNCNKQNKQNKLNNLYDKIKQDKIRLDNIK